MNPRGLFETILTEALAAQVSELDESLRAESTPLHAADASDRLALLLGQVVQRARSRHFLMTCVSAKASR